MSRVTRWVWYPFGAVLRFILRKGKRIAVTVVGGSLLVAGVAFLVLPGPGVLLILAGLAILATEYIWAERALNYAKDKASRATDRVRRKRS